MADLQLIFDFLMNILQSLSTLIMQHFILTVSFSLIILKILVDVLYKIRIKFFRG